RRLHRRHRSWLHGHSLTVVLVLTWTGWIWWYVRIDSNGKAGQVVGNIVSEWSQILSLVWFTKYLIERGSKQSHGYSLSSAYACFRMPAISSTTPPATAAIPSTGGNGSVFCRSAVACT